MQVILILQLKFRYHLANKFLLAVIYHIDALKDLVVYSNVWSKNVQA